ncbi:hypothetical protein M8C21_032207 [Ambrosia artemisiifolia]|uniref:Uncharacterized protein n=1 Tax=Ambrosia artemisiifolia TaxID=4212 RepID=A0AAD5BVE8_AMBAR|nr:hypothetical protein M8C21_032207 [Ambrosia artemisiifolia]
MCFSIFIYMKPLVLSSSSFYQFLCCFYSFWICCCWFRLRISNRERKEEFEL